MFLLSPTPDYHSNHTHLYYKTVKLTKFSSAVNRADSSMKLKFFIKTILDVHWNSNKNKEQINIEFLAFLLDPGIFQPCIWPNLYVCSLFELYTSLFQLVLCWAVLDCKITTHFWKEGSGVLPGKFWKPRKQRKPSLIILQGQFYLQKMKNFRGQCSHLLYALFENKDLDRYRHISILDLGCIRPDLLITLYSDFSISGHYSDVNKPNWCNPLIFNSPVFWQSVQLNIQEFCSFDSQVQHILSLLLDEHRALLP